MHSLPCSMHHCVGMHGSYFMLCVILFLNLLAKSTVTVMANHKTILFVWMKIFVSNFCDQTLWTGKLINQLTPWGKSKFHALLFLSFLLACFLQMVIPPDGGGTFDMNAFAVHVMSVDYQAQTRYIGLYANMDQTRDINTIIWRWLFSLLWRWLPLS